MINLIISCSSTRLPFVTFFCGQHVKLPSHLHNEVHALLPLLVHVVVQFEYFCTYTHVDLALDGCLMKWSVVPVVSGIRVRPMVKQQTHHLDHNNTTQHYKGP